MLELWGAHRHCFGNWLIVVFWDEVRIILEIVEIVVGISPELFLLSVAEDVSLELSGFTFEFNCSF